MERLTKRQIILIFTVMWMMFSYRLVNASNYSPNSTLTLTLKEAISMALGNNQTVLKEAKNNLQLAHQNLIAVHKTYQPKINQDAASQRTTNENEITSTTQDKHSISLNSTWSKIIFTSRLLTLSEGYNLTATNDKNYASNKFSSNPYIGIELIQPLSEGGRLQQRLPLINSDENLQLAKINYVLIEEQLILDVINNYYQLIRIKALIKQAEEQVELSRQLLKWTQASLKAEQIPELDVMNARVQLANDEDFLVQVQEQQITLQKNFIRLLGVNEDLTLELSNEINVKILNKNKDVDESINEALKNRLELKRAKIEIEQIKRNIPISKSSNKPTLNISGNYSWTNEAGELKEAIKNLPQRNWLVQAKFSFPFFDSGTTKNQVKIAEINYQKVLDSFDILKKNIIEEINQIQRNLEKNERRLKVLEVNLKIAQEARRISQLKYEMGLITIREVLESQIAYSKVKSSIDDAKTDYFINFAKLYKAIGRLKDEYL